MKNELLTNINATLTGRYSAKEENLENVPKYLEINTQYTESCAEPNSNNLDEYRIEVILGNRVHCEKRFLKYEKENIGRNIAHYIYGDPKQKLIELLYKLKCCNLDQQIYNDLEEVIKYMEYKNEYV